MIDIIKIKDNLVMSFRDMKIKLLSNEYLTDYIDIIRSDFYNEYLDYKFNMDIDKEQLISIMENKVKLYDINDINTREFRFIVTNKYEIIVAGFTLHIKDMCIEVAYFVVPEYQKQGIASEMLQNIIIWLPMINRDIKYIKALVQYKNKKSIGLLNKVGFKSKRRLKGRFGTNIEFWREI